MKTQSASDKNQPTARIKHFKKEKEIMPENCDSCSYQNCAALNQTEDNGSQANSISPCCPDIAHRKHILQNSTGILTLLVDKDTADNVLCCVLLCLGCDVSPPLLGRGVRGCFISFHRARSDRARRLSPLPARNPGGGSLEQIDSPPSLPPG